ncbi:MAG TPA: hypothetical protein VGR97_14115 [Candidatus Acidoferrales bacterium]|nr:hypothetical protein [Candidatus Acidoferrales bacterium]
MLPSPTHGKIAQLAHDILNGVAQTEGEFMTFPKLILALPCLISVTLVAQEAKVNQGTERKQEAR